MKFEKSKKVMDQEYKLESNGLTGGGIFTDGTGHIISEVHLIGGGSSPFSQIPISMDDTWHKLDLMAKI